MTKPLALKAYAVCENDESSGAIYFAKHAITAKRRGANEHADGDITYVTCNRVPWADHLAETGDVPAALMVDHGWHFECAGCGCRVDSDLFWDRDIWSEDIQGTQSTMVFCTPVCEARHQLERAEAKHREKRWIRRFEKIIRARFPDAQIVRDGQFNRPHAYATKHRDGIWRVEQVNVSFTWPGQQVGAASLRVNTATDWAARPTVTRRGKPHWTCCSGDREAFEAYAAAWAEQLRAKKAAEGT